MESSTHDREETPVPPQSRQSSLFAVIELSREQEAERRRSAARLATCLVSAHGGDRTAHKRAQVTVHEALRCVEDTMGRPTNIFSRSLEQGFNEKGVRGITVPADKHLAMPSGTIITSSNVSFDKEQDHDPKDLPVPVAEIRQGRSRRVNLCEDLMVSALETTRLLAS